MGFQNFFPLILQKDRRAENKCRVYSFERGGRGIIYTMFNFVDEIHEITIA
jgi:hypothetical protein